MKNLQLILLPKHIIDLLHLVLIKKFPNIAHVDNKIQRVLISSLLSEQFQSFLKSPPFSMFGKKIYKIKIIPWCVTQFLCPVMVPLLKDFFLYYPHPILCHLVTVLPILFILNWNLLIFACQGNHQKDHSYGLFCPACTLMIACIIVAYVLPAVHYLV